LLREEVLKNALARLDTSQQQEEEEKEREVAIALSHLARSLIYFMVYTATLFELLLHLIRRIPNVFWHVRNTCDFFL
jgi:hypothetical protein